MYRSWLNPMFSSVPKSTRLSGALPMAFYAAINPLSWVKSPYLGIFTFVVTWWVLWNLNVWGLVRFRGETSEDYWWWWVLRSSLYAFFLNFIPLFLLYLAILIVIKISVTIRIS